MLPRPPTHSTEDLLDVGEYLGADHIACFLQIYNLPFVLVLLFTQLLLDGLLSLVAAPSRPQAPPTPSATATTRVQGPLETLVCNSCLPCLYMSVHCVKLRHPLFAPPPDHLWPP